MYTYVNYFSSSFILTLFINLLIIIDIKIKIHLSWLNAFSLIYSYYFIFNLSSFAIYQVHNVSWYNSFNPTSVLYYYLHQFITYFRSEDKTCILQLFLFLHLFRYSTSKTLASAILTNLVVYTASLLMGNAMEKTQNTPVSRWSTIQEPIDLAPQIVVFIFAGIGSKPNLWFG